MKKSIILKKKKKTTNTYMREAIDYEIIVFKEREDLFVTIKKYNKMTNSFSLSREEGEKTVYIDNGYYVVELTPLNENYNIRFYLDNNKNIIDYYIDITLFNGEEDKIPYYVDLYLDILHKPSTNEIYFDDEDELEEALNNKSISKKDYNLAYKVGHKVIEEIKQDKNVYLKTDIKKLVERYF